MHRPEESSSNEPGAREKNLIVKLANEGRYEEAASHAQEMIARFPQHGFGWKALGVLFKNMGRSAEALAPMQKAAELSSGDADAYYNLGIVFQELGRTEEAEVSYRQALQYKPDFADAHNNLGNILQQLGRTEEAEASYRKALQYQPDFADAHNNLGNILQQLGRTEEAELSYRLALRIAPNDAEVHNNLGNALRILGRLDEAEASYRQALQINPDFTEVYCNLGIILHALMRQDEAEVIYRCALQIKPDYAEVYCNLGATLREMGRQDEAVASYQHALQINPGYAEARWQLAIAQIPIVADTFEEIAVCRAKFLHEIAELDAWFDGERAEYGYKVVGMSQPFYLAYQEDNNREVLSQYGMLCARLMKHWYDKQIFSSLHIVPGDVIRVGIVSAHFHNHSVWGAIVKGWFQHLDRNRIELHAFHLGSRQDDETNWVKSRSASFEQKKAGLEQWVQAIQKKQLDVLIYPEIGMDSMTLKLASLRLAPIQIAAWGHPETSGLPTMDYYLSAEYFESRDAQNNYTEQLIRLPHLGCCYYPAQVISFDPDFEGLGINTNVPLLLSPGLPFKYAPQHDHVFVEIARQLEKCQFIFFISDSNLIAKLRQRLNSVFAKAGMNFNDYCVYIPWQDKSAFYGLMKRADVFMDTIGFSGFNTAMQAVECGLPIVTREGQFMRGKLASGILKRMGMADLIAGTEEEYVSLVVKLVQDSGFRQNICQRIEKSRPVLFGDTAPVRALEDFLVNVAKRQL